jgi:DNA mismatch repair protein MutS2
VRDFERLSSELASRVAALTESQHAIESERRALNSLRAEEEARVGEIKRRSSEAVAREAASLLDQVKSARAELERARTSLKAEHATRAQVAQAERQVAAVAARIAVDGDLAPKAESLEPSDASAIDPASLTQGASVYVPRLRADAVVLEAPAKGKARIGVGPLKLWVDVGDLRARKQSAHAETEPRRDKPAPAPRPKTRTPDNTLDVRGLRVDDALSLVESFVDRLYAADETVGYVVHGHGTGALRDAIRAHLREHVELAKAVEPAERDDGGEALTVVHLI